MKSILCVGELLVDLIPGAPIHLEEPCYTPHAGGSVANVAVAAARLGGASRFLGTISDDTFGQLLRQVLRDNQVDTDYAPEVPGIPTTLALVTLQPGGQRYFTFFRDRTSDTQLQTTHLSPEAWHDVAICHSGGILLSNEPARSAMLAAIAYTRQQGAIVSFDMNVRPTLWSTPEEIKRIMVPVIEQVDILKLSAEEAEFIEGEPETSSLRLPTPEHEQLLQLGEKLLAKGPRLVIITLGSRGAILQTPTQRVEVSASKVDALDTTGAGDAFMGAVLYQLLQQGCATPADLLALSAEQLASLGQFANQVAGLSCTRYGGISSFPFLNELS